MVDVHPALGEPDASDPVQQEQRHRRVLQQQPQLVTDGYFLRDVLELDEIVGLPVGALPQERDDDQGVDHRAVRADEPGHVLVAAGRAGGVG